MTQERKCVFQFCCLKRCSEDSTTFVRVAFLCEWLKGSKSWLHRPTSERLPSSGASAQPLLMATEWSPWEVWKSMGPLWKSLHSTEVRGSKFDPKLCPGNILTQRCPVLDRCGKKVQCYQSLGAVLLWKALSSHRVGVLCTLCCHLLEVKSFKSFSMIWESLGWLTYAGWYYCPCSSDGHCRPETAGPDLLELPPFPAWHVQVYL